jgi:2-methylaconitate cis-trans-isomerase PrpF
VITLPKAGVSSEPCIFHVSCVDAANPFVFVSAEELGLQGQETLTELSATVTQVLLQIRAQAAVLMGMATFVEAAALIMGTPKIAIVGPSWQYSATSGRVVQAGEYDLWVRAYSMGNPHPTIQMTGAVCLGASSAIPDTLVNKYFREGRESRGRSFAGPMVIGHAGGTMEVEGVCRLQDGEIAVECGTVYRTCRRLMEGLVLCYA